MRLLILTQKVDKNDDVLGFMHGWITEFSKHCESLIVICLEEGDHDLPKNVKVLSLGKEDQADREKYISNFYKYIWLERNSYDAVFVHMNPEYVVLGGLFWRLWGKKIGLWYAHGYVPWTLQIARIFVNNIFTSTKSGCRINSRKIKVIGQGIDIEKFNDERIKPNDPDTPFRIVTIGRISPSKDYETLIMAADILRDRGIKFKIDIVGGLGLTNQGSYFQKLDHLVVVKELGRFITFVGPIPNENILPYLHRADLFVNMGQTGSLDKAVLEAMSTGLPILTCNEAFAEVLGDYSDAMMYPKRDFETFADRMQRIAISPYPMLEKIGQDLREIIVQKHSLPVFAKTIINSLKK